MEIDSDPANYRIHMVMTGQLLDIVERRAQTKLGILPANQEKAQPPPQPRTDFMPGEDDLLSSVSRAWSTYSKLSTDPSLLHKLKHMQSKIKAKVEAVEKVVNHKNITLKPKVLSKAGVTWNQLEVLRCEYEGVLDEAFEKCGVKCEEPNNIVKNWRSCSC